MCGRYVLWDIEHLHEHFDAVVPEDVTSNYNVAPTQVMPVYTPGELALMRWGLIPSWSKDEKVAYKLFNARSEGVFTKPLWKHAVKHRRCLVPANGFYEWKNTDSGKRPYYVHFSDDELFAFAGVWETWRHAGRAATTFSILTTTPNKEMSRIHDRMPVIIPKSQYGMWLEATEQDDLRALLQPLPDGSLQIYEVSRDVNVAKINSQQLIAPLNSK